MDFWLGVAGGFGLGWAAAFIVAIYIRHYDRTRGYERARRTYQ